MQVFVIDDEGKKKVAELKANAEAQPFGPDMIRARAKAEAIPGDTLIHTCFLDIGWKVVYTIDAMVRATDPSKHDGMCRHLSISNQVNGKLPHPAVVGEIMGLLGYLHKIGDAEVYPYVENHADGYEIINIIERI